MPQYKTSEFNCRPVWWIEGKLRKPFSLSSRLRKSHSSSFPMATSGPNYNARAASSSRPGASPLPRHAGPNNQTRVLDTQAGRILCIADIRGRLSHLNVLAKENNAKAIIHTGDFGFFGTLSLL